MLDDETMEGSHWNLIRATALDFEPWMEKENDEKAGITEERQCNDVCKIESSKWTLAKGYSLITNIQQLEQNAGKWWHYMFIYRCWFYYMSHWALEHAIL